MTKRLVAKTGVYQKDGQEKGEYTKIGVVLSNENGEFALFDPAVNLAGVLLKQNALAAKQGKQASDMVMVSIFTDDQQGQQQNNQGQQQGGYQQQNNQQQNNQGYQQQGQQQNNQGGYNQAPQ